MPERDRNRKFARSALRAAFGVFLIMAAGASVAYAEDDDDDLPDAKAARAFLRMLGLRNGQEAGIEYKERPPLVLPPTTNLPPPGSATSLAKKTPAWPDDPDVKAAKAAAKAKKEHKPIGDYFVDVPHERLTPQEWDVGKGLPQTPDATQRSGASSAGGGNVEQTPAELGYKATFWENITSFGGFFKTERVESKVFVREPSREALTDPPAGYRTPSPNQPYGVNDKDNGMTAKGQQDPQTVRGNQ